MKICSEFWRLFKKKCQPYLQACGMGRTQFFTNSEIMKICSEFWRLFKKKCQPYLQACGMGRTQFFTNSF